MKMKKAVLALAALAVAIAVVPLAAAKGDPSDKGVANAKTTEIQILGLNDFHGAIQPPSGSAGRLGPSGTPEFGGVEYLATHVRALRATNPNTLFVSAGDLIGASPLLSGIFHDEPTIEAFNLMDLDYNGVGNHEFDEGIEELHRMQFGGCHPVDGCFDADGFAGAEFDFLAANVSFKDSGETIFPPYAIEHFNGVKVAIIGMTTLETPSIVVPTAVSSVNFAAEAETVNALVPHLKAQNVETIIVLLHEGGRTSTAGNGTGAGVGMINECANPTGAIPPIVDAMDDEVDVVVTGHTNWAVNCVLDGKIVTGAGSNGRIVTDIDLTISRASKDVVSAKVNNVPVSRDVAKAPDLTELFEKYDALSAPLANRIVGTATADLLRAGNTAGESALGDVIADAQLAATSDPVFGGAVVAFMNPGGIRTDIAAGDVTYGELFAVQPFSNVMTVMTCTGAQIEQILEQQWGVNSAGALVTNILQVSDGFTYTYDFARPMGDRIDISSIKIDGTPVSALTSPGARSRTASSSPCSRSAT